MKKLNIAVLFGGCSLEYSVSLESAHAVITHMDRTKYSPVLVGISPKGNWLHFTGAVEKIKQDTWNNPDDCAPALVSPDRDAPGLLVQTTAGVEKISLDAAFPVLHGRNGEDGTVQGLFELAGIPLVGCGVLASALCMDKDRAHKLAQAAGITIPSSTVLTKKASKENAFACAEKLGYPLFVKPVRAGSSYGITRVMERGGLPAALELAFAYDDHIILEEAISGFEVGCAVLGNDTLTVGELDEIELADGFFDFTEKYTLKTSEIHVPARISPAKTAEMKEAAQRIYKVLGCQGFARVDMFLDKDGRVVFNEVNTIPGFTAHSRYPSMMKAIGMSFEQVISNVIELAVSK
ncbi:D-alanine--D-serine ligase VanG [Pseudoflavonifractor sp. 524-17]|uniref:D-alanine--D-serine ligase VanG n=1 Tax=Pseudoflavonifractor sp. 524-17 TaxID=2304577 RepID=UPI0013799290|nr:D-alanine--D-serine ligase VanG [Pseudoflavonifractor sp. 524-17]NCE64943.1 D-alanine--D-serine ligase VanG [Pseudoflavonifractor sp. 524-17]